MTDAAIEAPAAGWTLETTGSYVPLLAFAGGAYLVALAVIHLLTPRLAAVSLPEPSAVR